MLIPILIGAGAGLSTSAGYTYNGVRFQNILLTSTRNAEFSDMYSGGFYPATKPLEEYWAWWSGAFGHNRYDQQNKVLIKYY